MNDTIEFRSDNSAGCAPEILAAIAAANSGTALAYGADNWTAALHERVAEVFECPHVAVFPVASGTAANALSLATLCPPWGSVLCHETAHVLRSECGATSMFSGGGVIRGLPGENSLLDPDALEQAFAATRWNDPHDSQPSVLSLTCPTDFGTIYDATQVTELARLARSRGMRVHLDGARIANALARLGRSPAELTWKAGVDILSLGATKNGVLSTDAIVCFDPALVEQLTYRLKRAGHVSSKMRFQSVQIDAYLRDGLWLDLAGRANAAMERLAVGMTGLGVELLADPPVNMAFARVDASVADRLEAAGLQFYRMGGPGVIRLVTNFATTVADIDAALGHLSAALR